MDDAVLLHEMSNSVPLPRFDLFGVPPTQQMIEKDIVTEHRPISSIDPASFLQFEIKSAVDEYIDMEKLYLYLKIKIKKPADSKLDQTKFFTSFAVVNNLLHSLIKQLDIFIGDQQFNTSSPTYAYKAYFENLLGFSKSAKDLSYLSSALWFNDEDEKSNNVDSKRTTLFSAFKPVDLFGKLHTDLSFQGRSLLGGSKLILRILFNEPSFYFLSDSFKPEFEFLEAAIYAHRAKVNQYVVDAHNAALSIAPAKYPITVSKVKNFTINSSAIDVNLDNVHNGQLPRRIFVAFVENSAFCGFYVKNPFYFNHFNITSLCVFLDGVQFPTKAFTPDFTNKNYVRELHSIYEALDMLDGESNFNINRMNYGVGNTIFGFNFTPDLSSGAGAVGHVNRIKYGTLRIALRFSETLTTTLTALVYCEFDKILEIDIARKVTIDLF